MTPKELYKEIEPVIIAYQLAGLEIYDIRYGKLSFTNDRYGMCFNVQNNGLYCLIVTDADSVIVDMLNRFKCSYEDAPRLIAKELELIYDKCTA